MRSDEELRPVMTRVRAGLDARTAGIVVTPPPFEAILARAQGQPPAPPTVAPLPLPSVASGPGGAVGGAAAGGATGSAGAGALPAAAVGSSLGATAGSGLGLSRSTPSAGRSIAAKAGLAIAAIVAVAALILFVVSRGSDDCAAGDRTCSTIETGLGGGTDSTPPDASSEESRDDDPPPITDDTTTTVDVPPSLDSTTTTMASTTTAPPPTTDPIVVQRDRLTARVEALVDSVFDADAESFATFFGPACNERQVSDAVELFEAIAPGFPEEARPDIGVAILDSTSGEATFSRFIEEAGGLVSNSMRWLFVDDEWYPESCDLFTGLLGAGG